MHMHSTPVQQLLTTAPEDFTGTFEDYKNTLEWLCDIYKAYINFGVDWTGQRWPQEAHNEMNHFLQTGEFPMPTADTDVDNDDGGASATGGISVAASLMNITIVTGGTESSTVVSDLSGIVGHC